MANTLPGQKRETKRLSSLVRVCKIVQTPILPVRSLRKLESGSAKAEAAVKFLDFWRGREMNSVERTGRVGVKHLEGGNIWKLYNIYVIENVKSILGRILILCLSTRQWPAFGQKELPLLSILFKAGMSSLQNLMRYQPVCFHFVDEKTRAPRC